MVPEIEPPPEEEPPGGPSLDPAPSDELEDCLRASSGGWRSVLYPPDWTPQATYADGFLHDFSYAGYQQGEALPDNTAGPEFLVDGLGADSLANAQIVQAALDSAVSAGGGRVVLPSGDFELAGALLVEGDGVVLGGQGASTRLHFVGAATNPIMFRGGREQNVGEAPLVTDGANRSVWVEVEDAGGFVEGQDISVGWIITDSFAQAHAMEDVWTLFRGEWKPFFRRRIVEIERGASPQRIRLDIPLRYPALVRDQASVRGDGGYLREVGLENIAISDAALDERQANTQGETKRQRRMIRFERVSDGWVRGVRSFSPEAADGDGHMRSGGIRVTNSKLVTIEDTHFRRPQNIREGGNGYLFEIFRSNEVLVRRSSGQEGRHNFSFNWDFGNSGHVISECESRKGRALTNGVVVPAQSDFHHSLAMAVLIEQSTIDDGWDAENRASQSSGAGHAVTQSVFWNNRGEGRIRSRQFGRGYAIGNQLPVVTNLQLDLLEGLANPDRSKFTAPEDLQEYGVGNLVPASLYQDQRWRRLGCPN